MAVTQGCDGDNSSPRHFGPRASECSLHRVSSKSASGGALLPSGHSFRRVSVQQTWRLTRRPGSGCNGESPSRGQARPRLQHKRHRADPLRSPLEKRSSPKSHPSDPSERIASLGQVASCLRLGRSVLPAYWAQRGGGEYTDGLDREVASRITPGRPHPAAHKRLEGHHEAAVAGDGAGALLLQPLDGLGEVALHRLRELPGLAAAGRRAAQRLPLRRHNKGRGKMSVAASGSSCAQPCGPGSERALEISAEPPYAHRPARADSPCGDGSGRRPSAQGSAPASRIQRHQCLSRPCPMPDGAKHGQNRGTASSPESKPRHWPGAVNRLLRLCDAPGQRLPPLSVQDQDQAVGRLAAFPCHTRKAETNGAEGLYERAVARELADATKNTAYERAVAFRPWRENDWGPGG